MPDLKNEEQLLYPCDLQSGLVDSFDWETGPLGINSGGWGLRLMAVL